MEKSVAEIVLVYLMMVYLTPLAASDIVTGVSLVGGSGPHEGTIQLNLLSDDGSQPPSVTRKVTLLHYRDAIATCRTLGYPGVNKVFRSSPYSADFSNESGFHLRCNEDNTVIGCQAFKRPHFHRYAVRCQNDTYLGCFRDTPDARPMTTSPCPPGPNSDYSCIDRYGMTTENCLAYCKTLSGSDVIITYAGVRAGIECTCGVISTTKLLGYRSSLSDIFCSSPCSGDRAYSNCGGVNHIAVFTTNAIIPAMPAGPGHADSVSHFSGHVHNAEVGLGVIAVLLAVLAMINVYVYARTRKMVSMTRQTTKAKATTSTTSNKHDVYQPVTTPPISDYYTRLDVPSRDQDDSYDTPISAGEAHSGLSVVAAEMEPVYEMYEVASSGSEEVVTTATPATSTASDKHNVFQPRTTPPTRNFDTRLDIPSRDQDDSYENLVPTGGAHSGVPVVAMEMQEPVYDEASSGREEVMTKTADSSDCFYEPVYTDRESAV